MFSLSKNLNSQRSQRKVLHYSILSTNAETLNCIHKIPNVMGQCPCTNQSYLSSAPEPILSVVSGTAAVVAAAVDTLKMTDPAEERLGGKVQTLPALTLPV